MNAVLTPAAPPAVWSTMRLWAKNRGLTDLVSLLDSQDAIRRRNPALAGLLWQSCLQLANLEANRSHVLPQPPVKA